MKASDVFQGEYYWTRSGAIRVIVSVALILPKLTRKGKVRSKRYIVRRTGESEYFPKARSAAQLHRVAEGCGTGDLNISRGSAYKYW